MDGFWIIIFFTAFCLQKWKKKESFSISFSTPAYYIKFGHASTKKNHVNIAVQVAKSSLFLYEIIFKKQSAVS